MNFIRRKVSIYTENDIDILRMGNSTPKKNTENEFSEKRIEFRWIFQKFTHKRVFFGGFITLERLYNSYQCGRSEIDPKHYFKFRKSHKTIYFLLKF